MCSRESLKMEISENTNVLSKIQRVGCVLKIISEGNPYYGFILEKEYGTLTDITESIDPTFNKHDAIENAISITRKSIEEDISFNDVESLRLGNSMEVIFELPGSLDSMKYYSQTYKDITGDILLWISLEDINKMFENKECQYSIDINVYRYLESILKNESI